MSPRLSYCAKIGSFSNCAVCCVSRVSSFTRVNISASRLLAANYFEVSFNFNLESVTFQFRIPSLSHGKTCLGVSAKSVKKMSESATLIKPRASILSTRIEINIS